MVALKVLLVVLAAALISCQNPAAPAAASAAASGTAGSSVTIAVPATPSGVTVAAGANSATLTWNACPTAASYNVYYVASTAYGSGNFTWSSVKSVTATTATITGLTGGTNYTFAVSAVNAGGESIYGGFLQAQAQDPAPAAPVFTLVNGYSNGFEIVWSAEPNITIYDVWYSTSPSVSQSTGTFAQVVNNTAFTATNLASSTTYYFIVAARTLGGTMGPPSAVTSVTTLP